MLRITISASEAYFLAVKLGRFQGHLIIKDRRKGHKRALSSSPWRVLHHTTWCHNISGVECGAARPECAVLAVRREKKQVDSPHFMEKYAMGASKHRLSVETGVRENQEMCRVVRRNGRGEVNSRDGSWRRRLQNLAVPDVTQVRLRDS